jgi:hypothetical protein
MNGLFRPPMLTRTRVGLAFAVAIAADAFQMLLGPFGWTFIDEVIDLVAMLLISGLLGFHLLFLPTFVVEIIPVVDMLPTWTGCVALVVALRRKQQRPPPPIATASPPPIPSSKVIDI